MRSKNATPIIFLHYGNSYYLKFVLAIAKKNNPGKKIILLGDKSNAHLTSLGIEHYYFSDYANSEKINQFNHVFHLVCGSDFEKIRTDAKFWVRFNFLKWFILLNFCKQKEIEKLWIFDSDVYILDNLSNYESLFESYDYTTHSHNEMIQGMINNLNILDYFCNLVIELFQNKQYLDAQKKDFLQNPRFALSMMRMFKEMFTHRKFKTIRFNLVINNKRFDECFFFDSEYVTNTVTKEKTRKIYPIIKKLFYNNGNFYLKLPASNNAYHLLITMNLSWVEPYVYPMLYKLHAHSKNKKYYTEIQLFKSPIGFRAFEKLKVVYNQIRSLTRSIPLRISKYLKIKPIHRSRKIIIGAGKNSTSGWYSTDINTLNILKTGDFAKYWQRNTISNFFAEHVFEYLTYEEIKIALRNCHQYLKKGGCLRIAVPDGYFPDVEYQKNIREGTNPIKITPIDVIGHQVVLNYQTLTELLKEFNFKVEYIEFWDEKGKFKKDKMDPAKGIVQRSRDDDPRNSPNEIKYTSLIIDAIKY